MFLRFARQVSLSVLCLFVTASAYAQTAQAPDTSAIRDEIAKLRQQLDALESRLAALEGAQTPQPATPVTAAPAAPPAQAEPVMSAGPEAPVYGSSVSNAKVFNPDMAVIGDFLGAAGRNTVNPQPALEMHESEASFQAVVDPYARADFFISFGEEGVNLEEGYVTFPAVPGGLLVRAGKMRAAFGKVNSLHNHVLPWTDRPLVTNNLVGGEDGIDDAGFSVARLIPNKVMFLEATGQVFRGDSGALYHSSKRGDLSYVGHLRAYRDVSDSQNVDFGASYSRGRNTAENAGNAGIVNLSPFTTTLFGVDATYRWRPLSRSIYHSFVGRFENVWSESFSRRSSGFYLSGDYQFARRWFAGGRYDRSGRAFDAAAIDKGQSAVLTYWPSEFSQIRGQYRRTDYAAGPTANELLFQLQFSIGAHGAHPF